MCDAELQRRKLRVESSVPENCDNYTVNRSIITKKKFLKCVKGYPPLKSSLSSLPRIQKPGYPKANIYYSFNEDTNPFTRVSEFGETSCGCSGSENAEYEPHFSAPLDPFTERDPYSEDEARLEELMRPPACFVIFGKPDIGCEKLGKLIAEECNCVFISPEVLIREEIAAKTDKGRWMKQALRSGRSLGPEIVMNLVESRVRARDVMHRGYVVEGLPLIPNDPDLDYAAYPLPPSPRNPNTPEEKFRVDRGDNEKEESVEEETASYEDEDEEEDEELSESEEETSASESLKSYDLARNPFASESLRIILRDDYPWDIGNQVREIFTAWPLKPSVIIYAICPDKDAVHRRNQFRLDPYTGETIDVGIWGIGEDSEVGVGSEEEKELVGEEFRKHYITRLANMRSNVEVQCKIFERFALPAIDKEVIAHSPDRVIRVDGRTSASRMFQVVKARLKNLRLPRVILPKKMLDEEGKEEEEIIQEESLNEEEFEGKSNEEAFQELTMRGAISRKFPWKLSRWKFSCPVAFLRGKKIEGSVKHAVRFMNRIYFLSSAAAAESFLENPRPFLLPPNPRVICKMLIYGPKQSGKSNLAEFLTLNYEGRLLDLRAIENREIEHRRNVMIREAIDEIRDEVIDEVIEGLEKRREEREVERIAALKVWCEKARVVVDKLLQILGNSSNKEEKGDNVDARQSPDEIEQKLEEMQKEIEEYNLTVLRTDSEFRERIMWDETALMDLAPNELLTIEASVNELDEQNPNVSRVLFERTQEARQATIELTVEDIGKLLVANINAAQAAPNYVGLEESGWVVDGMYPDAVLLEFLLENGVEVEEVVVIHEAEPYEYLIDQWRRKKVFDEEEECRIVESSVELNLAEDIEKIENAEGYESNTFFAKESISSKFDIAELNEYVEDLKNFDASWEMVIEKVRETGAGIIDVQLPIENGIESYVKKQIDERYHFEAREITEEEKYREAVDSNVSEISSNYDEFIDDDDDEGEENITEKSLPRQDNRRLGDTGLYCPVALRRHHVLWKGKEEFSALFMDKIYLLSSRAALNEFLRQPRDYAAYKKPVESIPPLRVSIVGPTGSGKSTLAKAISLEYGLAHIDFSERLDQYLKDRWIPLIGRKYGDSFAVEDKEVISETELPEDLEDQRYNCDRETIQAFLRKYLKEGAVLPNRMLKECLTNLFQSPYSSVGLVFDNFPRSSYDALAACENFSVPEIVVELICSIEETQARMIPKLYEAWKQEQDKKISDEEIRFATETQRVVEKREKFIRKRMKERRRIRRARLSNSSGEDEEENGEMEDKTNETSLISGGESVPSIMKESFTSVKELSIGSDDSDDSTIGEPDESQAEFDRAELWEEALITYEDPVKFEDWEDPETARERIGQEVNQGYESSSEKLASARSKFVEQSIPWIELDAEKNETSVLISLMKILDPYVFRNASFLERVYEVDAETAERLLDCGYYLLSSFGRTCPVEMSENEIPFQMLSVPETLEEIFPVLHRNYVYWIAGKKRLTKFVEHPLKYLDQDSCAPSIPVRIAIIGPPKSGKTTIADRFARTYGMKTITRGQALRHTLRQFSWTELASLTDAHLRGGHTALNESIARAVELYSIDPSCASHGYVLDGFPESQAEAQELAFLGIWPMIIVDLRADLDFCLQCLAADSDSLSRPPTYSPCYLSHQYEEWEKGSEGFRSWLNNFSQNLFAVDATVQKFAVWKRVDEEVRRRLFSIRNYFREADYDKAHLLTHMCVSPYEFRQRQSLYESYCPVCFGFDNVLTLSKTPPSQEGMVQFRENFYWVCKNHLRNFLADPWAILSSMKEVVLPKFRPEIIDQKIDVDHACWAKRLKTLGFCSVSYLDNLPDRKVIEGLKTLGVMFMDGLYLFCSLECREKFISRPWKYANVEINFRHSLPSVKVNGLPNLGFLEQTVARLIVQAVNRVSVLRAKLPGMTPDVTAAVYIGVYLKIHNPESDLNDVAVYEEVMRRMNARRKFLQVALRNAKKMINPYVYFPPEDINVKPKIYETVQSSSASSSSVQFRRDILSLDKFKRTSSGSRFSA